MITNFEMCGNDMLWRDIRFEKPTEADGDKHGYILHLLRGGIVCRGMWGSIDGTVAWMPLSVLPAFDPIPDPPEGWRFAEKGEAFDKRAMCWSWIRDEWKPTQQLDNYDPSMTYIVPIDPPEPTYRPFANAAEFKPHFGQLIKEKAIEDFRTVATSFSDKGVWLAGASIATAYAEAFEIYEFGNGKPFGIEVK